ncbi:amidase [Acinetobacter calcoaceticus]|uniref:Amidase n=1 Tax=Acinetobacter calcoaceticus TaxID=471 RepID=A0A4R1XQS6_ACICA|nr:amidase [Acinetobacter calcoaceticus]
MTVIVHPLHLGNGQIKVLIKDSINIQATRTQAGSQALADAPVASEHAEVVENILQNNGLIIGKTNLHELAFGITGINAYTGTPINPKYPQLIPGGSSSGSAVAVAAGLCDFSLGTDTGGSIRMPAACCGVFGLKPTFARISRKGVLPEHSSLDCVGPFAQDIAQLIQAMQMIDPSFDLNVVDRLDPSNLALKILAVPADQQIWESIDLFLKQAGVAELPIATSDYLSDAFDAAMHIINVENHHAFGHLIPSGKLGADIEQRLKNAALTSQAQFEDAKKIAELFRDEIDHLLADVDALILPTLPHRPPELADVAQTPQLLQLTALVRPFNLSGHPALTIPLQAADGFPVGLQIVTRHGQDEKLCLIAKLLLDQFYSLQSEGVVL